VVNTPCILVFLTSKVRFPVEGGRSSVPPEKCCACSYFNQGLSTFLRPGPILSLYRLAGRQVTKEDSLLKGHGNLLKMLLNYANHCKKVHKYSNPSVYEQSVYLFFSLRANFRLCELLPLANRSLFPSGSNGKLIFVLRIFALRAVLEDRIKIVNRMITVLCLF
jgi:hypothetical protein